MDGSFQLGFRRANLSPTIRAFEEYEKALPKQFETAMRKGAMYVKREAQRLTPVDTGRLKKSARIGQRNSGFETIVHVSFNTHYAVYVHERVDILHRNGQAKFLEDVLRHQKLEIAGVILQSLRDQQKKQSRRGRR